MRTSRSVVAAILATAILPACRSEPAQPVKRDVAGVVNFVQVAPGVASGGRIALDAFSSLTKGGITAVIAVVMEGEAGTDLVAERKAAEAAGMKYLHVPFSGAALNEEIVATFLKAVEATSGDHVLIHCGSGNRVAALWLIKRVVRDKWPVEKAIAEAEAAGLTRPALKEMALAYLKARQ